jgi:alpha-N-arabinofuranosidase
MRSQIFLPLLTGLALIACSEDAQGPTAPPADTGGNGDGVGDGDGDGTEGVPSDGMPSDGSDGMPSDSEEGVMPMDFEGMQPEPTGVVECDESAVGGVAPSTLTVDVGGASTVIPKEIFGVLLEILGNNVNNGIYVGAGSAIPNTRGIRNDIIEGFREAGVGAIQWPGGCAANNYNWQPNVNPINTMGTDLFMDFSLMVDAEPFLVGRPRDQFAESNREWVEYINNNPDHPEWNLKYFKIGNEVWGCGGNLGHDAAGLATYETWYDANYEALDPPVNGKDLFLVGATAGVWTINPNTTNWLTLMLEPTSLINRVDGIELHDYLYYPEGSGTPIPNVGFSEDQYYGIVNSANQGQLAPRLRDV